MPGSFLAPPFEDALFDALLALNNAHAQELSYKTPDEFHALLSQASFVRAAPRGLAFLVAFNEACGYNNPNFAWFSARYPRFNYVDRVVVSQQARGKGFARSLYGCLEADARLEHRERIVCEVNSLPPNPQSEAFHSALGFIPVGEQMLTDSGKTVRYWVRELF